jgi:hypothetical protein
MNNFFEKSRADETYHLNEKRTYEENYFSDDHTLEENEESEHEFHEIEKYRHDSVFEHN